MLRIVLQRKYFFSFSVVWLKLCVRYRNLHRDGICIKTKRPLFDLKGNRERTKTKWYARIVTEQTSRERNNGKEPRGMKETVWGYKELFYRESTVCVIGNSGYRGMNEVRL